MDALLKEEGRNFAVLLDSFLGLLDNPDKILSVGQDAARQESNPFVGILLRQLRIMREDPLVFSIRDCAGKRLFIGHLVTT